MKYSEEDRDQAATVLSICACQGLGWTIYISQAVACLGLSQKVEGLAKAAWDDVRSRYMPPYNWRDLYAEAESRIRNGETL